MQLTVKAAMFHKLGNIETFYIIVDEDRAKLIQKRLILERTKMIDCLKNLEHGGIVSNIFQPKNKALQKDIDRLVNIKKELKKSIQSIKEFFK